jgi:hypothetical protein
MNATDATTPVTDAANAGDVTAISCPECGDDFEDRAPENYLVPGVRPEYRHVSDRTALCTHGRDRAPARIRHPC